MLISALFDKFKTRALLSLPTRGHFKPLDEYHGFDLLVAAPIRGGLQFDTDAWALWQAEQTAAIGVIQLDTAHPGRFTLRHAWNG